MNKHAITTTDRLATVLGEDRGATFDKQTLLGPHLTADWGRDAGRRGPERTTLGRVWCVSIGGGLPSFR